MLALFHLFSFHLECFALFSNVLFFDSSLEYQFGSWRPAINTCLPNYTLQSDEWIDGWSDERIDGWSDEWIDGWSDEWIGLMSGLLYFWVTSRNIS